ncbi:DUF2563 family protein [[Mycobacterium] burgundiense]|uniref:DUF2563 family protein n=1 Tax=[Mycobacterium] burgundiense TaxID=3064286 RepID=A0ABM9M2F1_9MYCO|nr:DUF2563 family protein [Mycolicibacterium sp. MU0053]CAJ1509031.1 DUF2563 family protein [Mycolicibacterium sp. MU0053]
MYVNTAGLRAGGTGSYNSADHAHQSAGTLSRTAVTSGIFGTFSEAKAFGRRVLGVHSHHVGLIEHHTEQLGKIGDHARCVATGFDDMERRNEAQIRAVRDAF